ncbi:GNAT family N-acetyltransferase [Aminobacter anthyllidis]|uniref:GNAT family N-acetyltransferase n=1 Tax=Aminobacter anthyllidis TaxID=1035067 RepID=A0A9X1AA12_9HYPH|nr:GNAT family N-acetyltransferase [Aminobacter anthyllidis]MBT1155967.1 GNAT family N-acetyltransferase [Aminobacter anthyllidis]
MEQIIRTQRPLTGVIRQLRPSDLPRFAEHLLRLDDQSRRDRFNGLTHDGFLQAYAERSFHEGATVIGYVEGDKVLAAAELHERAEASEPTAEIAFSVEREIQHRGIGGRLFQRLVAQARGLGYLRLQVTTHSNNSAMKALARRFNAKLSFQQGETNGIIELNGETDLDADRRAPTDLGRRATGKAIAA